MNLRILNHVEASCRARVGRALLTRCGSNNHKQLSNDNCIHGYDSIYTSSSYSDNGLRVIETEAGKGTKKLPAAETSISFQLENQGWIGEKHDCKCRPPQYEQLVNNSKFLKEGEVLPEKGVRH